MNAFLNYLLEASIGLCLFLLVYKVLLNKETNFTAGRIFLLTGIMASLVFPLITINTENSPVPSMNLSIENYTPVGMQSEAINSMPEATITIWQILVTVYLTGFAIFLTVFLYRLSSIIRILKHSIRYQFLGRTIVEVKGHHTPFSFFNYIFISNAPTLSENDKQQIVEHESFHAHLYHSLDIILINIVGIVFWFHPLVRSYKKTLVQLHEFEADARAVEKHDVDEYCSLLARTALYSADFKLANHFSNSLTVKRINMMRTLKQKTKRWKLAAVAVMLPLFFFAVACQDQMMDDAIELANNSTMALDYPKQVQEKLDKLQKEFPDNKFVVIEPQQESGLMMAEDMKKSLAHINPNSIKSVEIVKHVQDDDGRTRSFVIINYDERVKAIVESAGKDGVFSVVEQSATPKGGIDQLKVFIKNNLNYKEPEKPGSVYIKFTINTDGSLTDFQVVKGMSAELDQEALRVAKLMENWEPGQQNGRPVRSTFILPFFFGNGQPNPPSGGGMLIAVTGTLNVEFKTTKEAGKTIVTGKVFDASGNPLPGANLILSGTAKGTTTDSEGEFKFETPEASGKLIASFIGHDSKTISF